jgi:hypothetical protein
MQQQWQQGGMHRLKSAVLQALGAYPHGDQRLGVRRYSHCQIAPFGGGGIAS